MLPVTGPPTSSFGRRTLFNGAPRGQHRGTDFRAGEGAPVVAPNAGLVVLAGDLYFTGNTVVLDHGLRLFSVFAHLSHMAVREGTSVAAGELVGAAGATGRVTGPHLHWTVRLGEAAVDPLSLVSTLDSLVEPPRP
jgi:murein DD-endopeptidase MepM/ murein hydrolase activator NlpD